MVQPGMPYEQIANSPYTSKEIIERVYGHNNPAFLAEVANAAAL
jgi:hypothetical protein